MAQTTLDIHRCYNLKILRKIGTFQFTLNELGRSIICCVQKQKDYSHPLIDQGAANEVRQK